MVSLEDAEKAVNKLYYVKYGDFVMPDDINTLSNALYYVLSIINERLNVNICFNPIFVRKGMIIDESHYNSLVDAIKTAYEYIYDVAGTHPKIKELKEIIDRLRYVRYGDFVLNTDHNDLVDAVKTILDILKIILIQGVWKEFQYNSHRISYFPLEAKAVITCLFINTFKVYAFTSDGDLIWCTDTGVGLEIQEPVTSPVVVDEDGYSYLEIYDWWDYDTFVIRIDNNGYLVWKIFFDHTSVEEVVIALDDEGYLYIPDIIKIDKDGNVIWQRYVSINSGVTFDSEGYIYAYETRGGLGTYAHIYKYNKDGDLIWEVALGSPDFGYTLSVDNYDNLYGTYYVWGWYGSFFSYDKDGNKRFSKTYGLDPLFYPSCSKSDRVYLGDNRGYVRCYDIYGNTLWATYTPNGFCNDVGLCYVIILALDEEDYVYVGGFQKKSLDIIDKEGNILRIIDIGTVVGAPSVDINKNIYICTGNLIKYDFYGNLIWKSSISGSFYGYNPTLVRGRLLI